MTAKEYFEQCLKEIDKHKALIEKANRDRDTQVFYVSKELYDKLKPYIKGYTIWKI